MHVRMNGHRNKFIIDNRSAFEKSAFSMYCFLEHKNQFSMEYFKLEIFNKDKFIQKYRTKIWRLNRIVETKFSRNFFIDIVCAFHF